MVLCGTTWWRQANGCPMLIVGSSLAGSYNSCAETFRLFAPNSPDESAIIILKTELISEYGKRA